MYCFRLCTCLILIQWASNMVEEDMTLNVSQSTIRFNISGSQSQKYVLQDSYTALFFSLIITGSIFMSFVIVSLPTLGGDQVNSLYYVWKYRYLRQLECLILESSYHLSEEWIIVESCSVAICIRINSWKTHISVYFHIFLSADGIDVCCTCTYNHI